MGIPANHQSTHKSNEIFSLLTIYQYTGIANSHDINHTTLSKSHFKTHVCLIQYINCSYYSKYFHRMNGVVPVECMHTSEGAEQQRIFIIMIISLTQLSNTILIASSTRNIVLFIQFIIIINVITACIAFNCTDVLKLFTVYIY